LPKPLALNTWTSFAMITDDAAEILKP
jgi:hypothetical protein